jgi:hypothetical protein
MRRAYKKLGLNLLILLLLLLQEKVTPINCNKKPLLYIFQHVGGTKYGYSEEKIKLTG